MRKIQKDKSVTIRINSDLYKKCIKKALELGLKEERVINVSEVIRIFIEGGVK